MTRAGSLPKPAAEFHGQSTFFVTLHWFMDSPPQRTKLTRKSSIWSFKTRLSLACFRSACSLFRTVSNHGCIEGDCHAEEPAEWFWINGKDRPVAGLRSNGKKSHAVSDNPTLPGDLTGLTGIGHRPF